MIKLLAILDSYKQGPDKYNYGSSYNVNYDSRSYDYVLLDNICSIVMVAPFSCSMIDNEAQYAKGEGRGEYDPTDYTYKTSLTMRSIFSKPNKSNKTHECADIPGAPIAQGIWGKGQNGIAIEI